MQNLSKIDTAKDLVTKEWVEAQDFLPSSAFTKTGIKNALGISDWALAASKPSYDDVYLKLAGGTINGNLTVSGQFKSQTSLASVSLLSNIFDVNASLKIQPGWNLYLNGEAIMKWSDLKSKIAYSFSEISSKPTTLAGYGITDAIIFSRAIDTTENKCYKHIGYGEPSGGWASTAGPAMAFGYDENNYVKVAFQSYNEHYQARPYYQHIRNGVKGEWIALLTERNFASYGLSLHSSASSWKPTDEGAYIGYVSGTNGWAAAGVGVSLAAGKYAGLMNFEGGADGLLNLYVSNNHNGSKRDWAKVLTDKNLSGLVTTTDYTSGDAWKINITGSANQFGVEYTGNLDTNSRNGLAHYNTGTIGKPSNYGMVMQMANVSKPVPGTAEHWITQIASSTYNDLYYRIRINTGAWQGWRKILTDGNIGTTSLPKINLNGWTISNWNQVRMGASVLIPMTGTQILYPNEHYTYVETLTSSSNISFTLTDDTSGVSVTKIYYIVFRTGSTTPTFTFNRTLYWKDGKSLTALAANKRYRIVIDDNLATLETYS